MTGDATRSGGVLGSLSKGAKWLGGIVVVALVGALVPLVVDRMSGPDELAAKLDKVGTRAPVTLAQFKAGRRDQPASFDGARVTLRFVAADADLTPADEPVQRRDPGPAETTTSVTPTTPETRTTPQTRTTTPGPSTTTTPDDTGTTERRGTATTPADDGDPTIPLVPVPEVADSLSTGLAQAIQATPNPISVPQACLSDVVADSCGLRSMQLQIGAADADGAASSLSTEQAKKRLTEIFNATRTRRSKSDPGKRELIGVTVDFNVQLTGFRGETVDIRWELLTDGGDAEVPSALSGRERVLLLKGEADKDTAGDEFWVPMPKAKGPYVIRIGVYDKKNTRLDFAVTDPFR